MSKDRATVQDQSREKQMIKILGLKDNEGRLEHDAEDEQGHIFELKSSTKNSFGTGRDVSVKMITKWRKRYWVLIDTKTIPKSEFYGEDIPQPKSLPLKFYTEEMSKITPLPKSW